MAGKAHFDQSQPTIRVKRGEAFAIELPAAPTTGYAWRLTHEPQESAAPQLAAPEESFTPANEAFGGGGTQHFDFQAGEAGSYELTFEYARPWRAEAEKKHTVKVQVEE